jgi:aspartate aminotransferase-like enzyme
MGYGSRQNNVLLFLAALEQLLARGGLAFTPGAGVAAANAAYAEA